MLGMIGRPIRVVDIVALELVIESGGLGHIEAAWKAGFFPLLSVSEGKRIVRTDICGPQTARCPNQDIVALLNVIVDFCGCPDTARGIAKPLVYFSAKGR